MLFDGFRRAHLSRRSCADRGAAAGVALRFPGVRVPALIDFMGVAREGSPNGERAQEP